MIYVLKAVKRAFGKNKAASICLVIGFISTFIIFLFTYGVYYQISEKKLAQVNNVRYLEFEIKKPKEVTYERVKKCFVNLNKSTCNAIRYIRLDSYFAGESEDYWNRFVFNFKLNEKGQVSYADMSKAYGFEMFSGRWFTEEEFNNASKVALGNSYEFVDTCGQGLYTQKFEYGSNDKYLINGEVYKRIGVNTFAVTPLIPITCLNDDAEVVLLGIVMKNESITTAQYLDIKEAFDKEFGDSIYLGDINLKELDLNYYYMISAILIVVALLCVVVLSLMISYMFREQSDLARTYIVCGVNTRKTCRLYAFEILSFLVVGIIISIQVFINIIMPVIDKNMEFFSDGYSNNTFVILSAIYLFVSYIVSVILARRELK